MSLSSPQSVNINAVATDLHRIEDTASSSLYQSADGTLSLKVSHQVNKGRARRMVRLDQTKIAENPLTAVNTYVKGGVYVVIDEPEFGFTDAELDYLVDGLTAWLTAANIAAVLASRH